MGSSRWGVWAHLGRVGGAQLSEVPDSGLLRVRGSPERSGWPGSSVDRSPHWRGGLSGRGTARERARSQLAPKIPNRPRGPAQERLLPRRLSETAYQRSPICRGSAPNVRACASPIPPRLLRGALAQARSHLGADSERGWLRRVPEGLRHHAESEPAPGALPPGSQDTEGPSDTDRAPHPSPGTHGPRWKPPGFQVSATSEGAFSHSLDLRRKLSANSPQLLPGRTTLGMHRAFPSFGLTSSPVKMELMTLTSGSWRFKWDDPLKVLSKGPARANANS
ncbi:uncharacterized protein LOC110260113 [Sus scrofa]|uniref:uncharacterized protein LOC110260113 n=1 Tax=Sus scrofa TaxID=9823 RepID=UPI000A2B8025|nr:uncharacterized protein LOC110260113 [Sus scrofa]